MIYTDPYSLQDAVYADLDTFIRLIRGQEEDFQELNGIVMKIVQDRSQIESNIYIHDEINRYKNIIQTFKQKGQKHQEKRQELELGHAKRLVVNDKFNVLLKRVSYRAFQIINTVMLQSCYKAGAMYQNFLRLRTQCQKLLTEQKQDKSIQIIKSICEFVHNKLCRLIDALVIIAENLENGNQEIIDKLSESQIQSLGSSIYKKDVSLKIIDSIRKERIQVIIDRKCCGRQQFKNVDQNRFQVHKNARKIIDSLKDVMQFNRQDFIEDFIGVCYDSKEATLRQLKKRNQFNNRQIIHFIQKKAKKRCRKLSSEPFIRQVKLKPNEEKGATPKQKEEPSQSIYTARKSLLLKFKENQYRQRTITSQFYRKMNRIQECKMRVKSNIKNKDQVKQNQFQKRSAIIKAIEKIICQNQELELKTMNESIGKTQQKLPPLNKRSYSVDQNYKAQLIESTEGNAKTLSNSNNLNAPPSKRARFQKSQVFPAKVKIQLNPSVLFNQQVSSKLICIGDSSKQVWF